MFAAHENAGITRPEIETGPTAKLDRLYKSVGKELADVLRPLDEKLLDVDGLDRLCASLEANPESPLAKKIRIGDLWLWGKPQGDTAPRIYAFKGGFVRDDYKLSEKKWHPCDCAVRK